MNVLAVIPARYASTRLPGKPLLSETGWPLIRHVYEQVQKAELVTQVLVATDDARIFTAVRAFHGQVEMTRADHPSGTDRIAEVASRHPQADIIVNVQGDEPEIEPETISRLVEVHRQSHADMSTLACPFPPDAPREGPGSPLDPNCVKVVLQHWEHGTSPILDTHGASPVAKGNFGMALYFSRALIPYPRDEKGNVTNPANHLLHLGLYAYSPAFVQRFIAWPQGRLEQIERLEQLRVLENGGKIAVGVVAKASIGIDTPADYAAFVERWINR